MTDYSHEVSAATKARLEAKLDALMVRVYECYPHLKDTFSRPTLAYNKSSRIAGTAKSRSNLITLSVMFLDRKAEHTDEMVEQTLPHELAHILEYVVYGGWERSRSGRRSVHGRRWKGIMVKVFGLSPDRCHEMVAEGAETRKLARQYLYACKCPEPHALTAIRHGKVLKGTRYSCRTCRAKLVHIVNQERAA